MTPPEGISDVDQVKRDEERLAELGYKQELSRGWSAFTNFAISFTIISVLAGCFTNFALAWNNGGPIAASIGWPVLCAFVLMVGLLDGRADLEVPDRGRALLVGARPRRQGLELDDRLVQHRRPARDRRLGRLRRARSSSTPCSGLYGLDIFGVNFGDTEHILGEQFLLFLIILFLYTLVNIFADRLLALINNISVGWHLLGVAVILGILIFVPDDHQSADFVFTERFNINGAFGGSTTALGFWLLVVPVGFVLTMYTQTGYDASAHTAEETRGAAKAAAQGVWRSVFFSALIGWVLLLAFLFAATDRPRSTRAPATRPSSSLRRSIRGRRSS